MDIKAKDIMTNEVISIEENSILYEAMKKLYSSNINCLPVLDEEGCLKGIVTETDFIYLDKKLNANSYYAYAESNIPVNKKVLVQNLSKIKTLKVKDIMTTKLTVIEEDESLEKIIDIIINKGIKTIPVVQDSKVTGIVTRKNILTYYLYL